MDSSETISSCLNLMRRLPPKDIENSLAGLLNLVPDVTDELLQRVDQVRIPYLVRGSPEEMVEGSSHSFLL